jgi:hypothetical protein
MLYTARRLFAFFEKYPALICVLNTYDPNNHVLWNGIFRFFYRRFPVRHDTYVENGKECIRSWWYNEEVYDPLWDKLFREYKAGVVFDRIIRPHFKKGET